MEEGYVGQVLSDVSKWYDDYVPIGTLKVLFGDYLTSNKLDSANNARRLFDGLYEAGVLKPEDLQIVFETVNVTKQFGLKLPLCPNVRHIFITKFTVYRQSLIKFGNDLTSKNVEGISGIFNTPVKTYVDGWALITDLENRRILSEENINDFINTMKRNGLPYPEHGTKQRINERREMPDAEHIDVPKVTTKERDHGKSNLEVKTEDSPETELLRRSQEEEYLTKKLVKQYTQNKIKTEKSCIGDGIKIQQSNQYAEPPVVEHGTEKREKDEEVVKNRPRGEQSTNVKNPEEMSYEEKGTEEQRPGQRVEDGINQLGQRPDAGGINERREGRKKLVCRIIFSVIVIGICVTIVIVLLLTLPMQSTMPTSQNTCITNLNTGELNGTMMDLSNMNFSGVCGETLAELFIMFPDITYFNLYNCGLTGQQLADMLDECDAQENILENNLLGLWSNNLSDIDGLSLSRLPRLLKRFNKNTALKWTDYHFTGRNLEDLLNVCDANCNFNWNWVDLSEVNLFSISGVNLVKIFVIFPTLTFLNLHQSNLSGNVVADMLFESERQGIVLNEIIGLWGNDLSDITDKSLMKLIHVIKRFNSETALKWTDYKFTASNLEDLVNVCVDDCIFTWELVDLSGVHLSLISGLTLYKIFTIFPNISFLNLHNCNLSGNIISDMLLEFERQSIALGGIIGLWGNDLSGITVKSLVNLIPILKRFDSNTALKWTDYKLTSAHLHDLVSVCTGEFNCSFTWSALDLSEVNLSQISGETLSRIFIMFPYMNFLNLYQCNLSGNIISDMLIECERLGLVLNEIIGLWNNDLSNMDGTSLEKLIHVLKRFDNNTALKWTDYKLTATHLRNLFNVCSTNCHFDWTRIDLSETSLVQLDGSIMANLFIIFPELMYLEMRDCDITETFLNSMLTECERINIDIKGKIIDVTGNGLSNPPQESLAIILI